MVRGRFMLSVVALAACAAACATPGDPRIRAAAQAGDSARAAALYRGYRDDRGAEDPRILAGLARITLAQALSAPSPTLKTRAIQLIEAHEVEALARDVVALVGDPSPAVAAAAAVAVLRAHPQAPDVAARMLESRDPRARAIAAEGIARKAGARARPNLEPLLVDPEPSVRAAAVAAIARWRRDADTPRLSTVAQSDGDPGVRAAALRAIGDTGRRRLLPVAERALDDDDPRVRRAAGYALAALGDRPALERAARSGDRAVALRTGAALWRLGHGELDGIGRALRSGDPQLQVAALAEVARSVTTREGLRVAGWMLPDPHPEVRLAAGRALIALGAERRGRRELEDALASAPAGLRAIAAGELARLGEPRGIAALEGLAQHEEAAVRRRAVRAHLAAGAPTAGLAAALADASPEIRLLAADAILKLAR